MVQVEVSFAVLVIAPQGWPGGRRRRVVAFRPSPAASGLRALRCRACVWEAGTLTGLRARGGLRFMPIRRKLHRCSSTPGMGAGVCCTLLTTLTGAGPSLGPMLRSRTPHQVDQEMYAWLTACQALRPTRPRSPAPVRTLRARRITGSSSRAARPSLTVTISQGKSGSPGTANRTRSPIRPQGTARHA